MAERTETVVYRYSGHCPECGAEQKGRQTESKADRVCDACRKEHAAEKFMANRVFLKGAEIIDFKGECALNYDGNLGPCNISELTVLTEDGRTISITTMRGLWREVEV
jgi:Fe-S cluster biogenesis protein NfuA